MNYVEATPTIDKLESIYGYADDIRKAVHFTTEVS